MTPPAEGERAREIVRLKASLPLHLASAIWASARNNAGPVGENEARMAADCVLVAAIKAWPETVDEITAALRAPQPRGLTGPKSDAEIAQAFHEAYERLAPDYHYETRRDSAVTWDRVPEINKRLMIAVVHELRATGALNLSAIEGAPAAGAELNGAAYEPFFKVFTSTGRPSEGTLTAGPDVVLTQGLTATLRRTADLLNRCVDKRAPASPRRAAPEDK